jgi:hypothetical protein
LEQAREQAEMDLLAVQSCRDMFADSIKQQEELLTDISISIQYNNICGNRNK